MNKISTWSAGVFLAGIFLAGVPRNHAWAAPATESTASPAGIPSAPSGLLSFTVSAKKTRAYPGEAIPVTLKLGYEADLAVRDIGYPRLLHPGLALREAGPPVPGSEERNGASWTTLEFTYLVSGRKAGDYLLGPATLDCSLLLPATASGSQGFFGDVVPERRRLKSDGVAVTVVPFPGEGKPADFRGAVGDFRLSAAATPRELAPGAPLTVTTRIEGEANLDTVSCPTVRESAEFTPYPPQVRQGTGAVVCEQVLMPKHTAVTALPPLRFSFFSPEHGAYRTLVQEPIPIRILPSAGREASSPPPAVPSAPPTAPAGRDGAGGEGIIRSVATQPLFWLLVISCAAVGGYGRMRKRARTSDSVPVLPEDSPAGAAEPAGECGMESVREAFTAGGDARFYDAAFLTLQRQLGKALGIRARSITADVVDTTLRSHGVDHHMVAAIGDLFAEIDRARYAGGSPGLNRGKTLHHLEEIIIFLEKR